ncbi:hypothetical protein [Nocardia callitridis]
MIPSSGVLALLESPPGELLDATAGVQTHTTPRRGDRAVRWVE